MKSNNLEVTYSQKNYSIQKVIAAVTIALFTIKIVAWYLTSSVAILTDALEYTINVVTSLVGLYSLALSARPKDYNHPYGHGKVEFLSAAIEGTLMIVSAFLIMYEAINNFQHPHVLSKLDFGIYLIIFTALVNYIMGEFALRKGKKNHSLALQASGHHIKSDTYATVGIILGLVAIHHTGYAWLDSVVALVFALIIILSGYKILRSSVAGIMDEADEALLKRVVSLLEASRRENWIDLHNLRIIKYGSTLHLDCHMTVPWYLNVHEAHREIDALNTLVTEHFPEGIELFVHTDGCLDFSCAICTKTDCPVRKFSFEKKINWTVYNISTNEKHNSV